MSDIFSFGQFDFEEVTNNYGSSKDVLNEQGMNIGRHVNSYGKEDWDDSGFAGSFSSDYLENTMVVEQLFSKDQQKSQQPAFPDFGILDDFYPDVPPPPFQSCPAEITKLSTVQIESSLQDNLQEEKPSTVPLASLGILRSAGRGFRRLNGEKIEVSRYDTAHVKPEPKIGPRKLSTEDILRLAGQKFIQSSSKLVDDIATPGLPFGSALLDLSYDEAKGVELVHNLLASAEKVGQQQYDRASKFLIQCCRFSSDTGNSVQRVVYYFCEALRERIGRETGRLKSSGRKLFVDLNVALTRPDPAIIAYHQEVPFIQILHFTGMQAIIDHVAEAKRVHVIDLDMRYGVQFTVLMQALVERQKCPLELLRITAVGTNSRSTMEETGERLASFAQSMNISFSFGVVMVSDMLDLKENLFGLDSEETVAVRASFTLMTMVAIPGRLEYLMRMIRNINPCVMVVVETEGNHNSPVFVNRFIEALFFHGALFDSLEDCMGQNNSNRKILESMFFSWGIQNIVAAEGEERTSRHVNISVWRAFFSRFGMVEEGLSTSSLYQANLVAKNFSCVDSCTFDMDGKCLILGWKGTPLYSLSAWKFV
ncbi:hypothetical protein NMG60_11025004 [Bertholletia excelsa]